MPIMNGYEACRQIVDFYSTNSMFKPVKTKKKLDKGYKKRKEVSGKEIAESVNNIIQDMYM